MNRYESALHQFLPLFSFAAVAVKWFFERREFLVQANSLLLNST